MPFHIPDVSNPVRSDRRKEEMFKPLFFCFKKYFCSNKFSLNYSKSCIKYLNFSKVNTLIPPRSTIRILIPPQKPPSHSFLLTTTSPFPKRNYYSDLWYYRLSLTVFTQLTSISKIIQYVFLGLASFNIMSGRIRPHCSLLSHLFIFIVV